MTAVLDAPVESAAPVVVRRVLGATYSFQFFFGLLLWTPIMYQYQRDLGLSDEQVFGIQSIYYLAFCLLEIPTGALADRFDYRHSLTAGGVVLVAANLLPVFAANYSGFLIHFLLIALARSLVSGAASAYLYEYLHRSGAGELYPQAEGRGRAYSLIGKVICWPVIAPLMLWQHSSPYWLTALSAAVAVGAAVMLPVLPAGPMAKAAESDQPKLLESVRGSLLAMRSSRLLVLVMVQGVAIFTLARIATVNVFQPLLSDKQVPLVWHGAVMAVMTVAEAFGAARPGWLRRRMSDLRAVFLLTTVLAVTLAATVGVGWALTIVLLCVFSLATGASYPIQRQLIGAAITTPRYRATLLSIESIIDRAVCAIVAVALGAALTHGALSEFLVWCGVGSIALMAVLALVVTRKRD